ncbi:MAG: hypothetical protein FWE13_05795, partial [Firmicutes bacterium]|nr:hypothetical protein [Bacillota bacterium]
MQETEKTKNQKIRRQNYFIKIAFVSLLVMLCSIVLFACFNISNPGWQTTTPYYPTDTTCTDSPYIDTVEPHRYFNLTVISGRDSGHFREGQSVAVMPASMPVRHTFIGWYENGERVSSLGFFRFTMPSRDKVLEAKFEYNPIPYFTLTVTGGAIWCSITQAGLSSGEFREGQRITLYLPYSTVFFIGWYENDQRVNSNHSFTFTMPARDVSLEARHHYWWLDTYRLDVINGYILGFGTYGYFLRDDWIEVRHTASIGSTTQRFLGWFEGEILLSTNYIFTFTMPSRDMTIEARVEEVLPIPEHMQVRWSYISAGRDHTLAIDTSGNLWAWGANWAGQLGNGTRIDRHSPIQIMIGTTFSALSAGGSHSLAIDTSGNLWAWGENWA